MINACVVLLACTHSAFATWVHVTCHGHPEFSVSDTAMSCSTFSMLEDDNGYFIPVVSKAEANRETGRLSVISVGGSIRNIGFNGGDSKAYLRKTFVIDGHWHGWMPVTVNIKLTYLFTGDGESQLVTNLWTYGSNELISDNQMSVVLRYDGFEHANLVHSLTDGTINLPDEGVYQNRAILNLSATQLVHHSTPTLDARVDLLGWSSPSLGSLGSRVSASVEADAQIVISIPREPRLARVK